MASCPEPAHEQSNDGKWIDIEDSLQYENGRIENNSQSLKASFASAATPQSALTTQSSTKISQQQTTEKLVWLQQGEYAPAWSLAGTTMVPGTQLRSAEFIGSMPLMVAQERPLSAGSQVQIDSVQETEQEDQAEQTIDEANRDKMTLDNLTFSVLFVETKLMTGLEKIQFKKLSALLSKMQTGKFD